MALSGENQTTVKKQKLDDVKYGEILLEGSTCRCPKTDDVRVQAEKTMADKLTELLDNSPGLEDEAKQAIGQQFEGFKKLFHVFLNESGETKIEWSEIKALPEKAILDYEKLEAKEAREDVQKLLKSLVIIKLNGGLGTSMGCQGPKSLIRVREEKNFLDLTVEQVRSLNRSYEVDVPLVLMNSFNTEDQMEEEVHKYSKKGVSIYSFTQSCHPRISQETLMPIAKNGTHSQKEGWYPPGHGDFYQAFKNSGYLEQLMKEGKTCCFVSNIDNLGARVDFGILDLLNKHNFVMEVTEKTLADVKGGTLISYKDKVRLLEVAQVPKDHLSEFEDIKKFKTFNTNNVWINLDAMQKLVKNDALEMEVIVNPKQLEGGQKVYQLETAIGAAMKSFDNAVGVNVPRSRFLPVKKTSDLLLLMSDLYSEHGGTVRLATSRPAPKVKLDDNYFKKVDDFAERFQSVPSLRDLVSLRVTGDVSFGKNIILSGKVWIEADKQGHVHIPDNAVIDNKLVRGHLNISES